MLLEKQRHDILRKSSTIIQKRFRGWYANKEYIKLRMASIKFQKDIRRFTMVRLFGLQKKYAFVLQAGKTIS